MPAKPEPWCACLFPFDVRTVGVGRTLPACTLAKQPQPSMSWVLSYGHRVVQDAGRNHTRAYRYTDTPWCGDFGIDDGKGRAWTHARARATRPAVRARRPAGDS